MHPIVAAFMALWLIGATAGAVVALSAGQFLWILLPLAGIALLTLGRWTGRADAEFIARELQRRVDRAAA
jgi:hypothetical protein